MTRRSGFTLLEVLLAILLTAIAVVIAGSALRTATMARERVTAHRDATERELRLRDVLTDMLRHAPDVELTDEALMRVVRAPDGAERLEFLSRGVRPPFGTGAIWRVTVAPSPRGLLLDAEPIGVHTGETALHAELSGITSMHVAFLERLGDRSAQAWRDDWPVARTRPAMIAIEFGDDSARAPLVVALDPLASTWTPAAVRP